MKKATKDSDDERIDRLIEWGTPIVIFLFAAELLVLGAVAIAKIAGLL